MAVVRAKLPNGDEVNIDERAVKVHGATVVDKPAFDKYGRPVPAKLNIHKGGSKAASEKKEG